jgi:predicted nucleic acid-binding protein
VAAYFADTSFWIALSSKRDQYHSQAVAWNVAAMLTASKIVTTEAVLWE